MKRMKIVLLLLLAFMLLPACGIQKANISEPAVTSTMPVSTSQPMPEKTPEPTPEPEPEPIAETASASGYTIEIVAAHKATDSNGDPIAAVELLFTNENSTPASFMSCAQIKGFQNGIQLFKEEMILERDYDWDTYYTEIKDGATITVFRPLPLQNTNDPIEIKIDIIDMMSGKFMASATKTMGLTE